MRTLRIPLLSYLAHLGFLLCCPLARGQDCSSVKDTNNVEYQVSEQEPSDAALCQPDSKVFTTNGMRHCFGRLQGQTGSNTFTELKCQATTSTGECQTQGCKEAVAELKKNMDMSVDPCDDFYKYSCGEFIKRSKIREDRPSISPSLEMRDKIREQVIAMLEEPSITGEHKTVKFAKTLYKACMDTEKIESLGLAPLKAMLKSAGGWPLLEGQAWREQDFTWYGMAYKLKNIGFSSNTFVTFRVDTDAKNNSQRVIILDHPRFPKVQMDTWRKGLKDPIVQGVFKLFQAMAIFFGADPTSTDKEIKDVIELFKKIAEVSRTLEEQRDEFDMYNPMSISELSSLDPNTPWLEYINTILGQNAIKVVKEERVIIETPKYFTGLSSIIENTPKRVQANFIMITTVYTMLGNLNKEAEMILLKGTSFMTGVQKLPPRSEKCVEEVKGSPIISSMYVKKHYKKESTVIVEDLIENIRVEMLALIERSDWMDEETRGKARQKAKEMEKLVGFPKEILDLDLIYETFYKNVKISPTTFLENKMNIDKEEISHSNSKLREKVERLDWKRYFLAAIVNAFYDDKTNAALIPAGFLQGVIFSTSRPEYLNYGALGFVIGHEITHGFDDTGSQKDGKGSLLDWWQPETKKKFKSRAQCMISQYGNYTVEGPRGKVPVNGVITQGENIADNAGLILAYTAYKAWVSKNGEEPSLPGISLTQKQLFWVSSAQFWCWKIRPEALEQKTKNDYHSPNQHRVQGPLSNLKEFSDDFKCAKGSQLNPERKCKVW